MPEDPGDEAFLDEVPPNADVCGSAEVWGGSRMGGAADDAAYEEKHCPEKTSNMLAVSKKNFPPFDGRSSGTLRKGHLRMQKPNLTVIF
jgi:hypothetical protein